MNTKALLKTVTNVIKQYGTPFKIYRDEYVKTSIGCVELTNKDVLVGQIIAVVDNSKTSAIQIKSNDRGRAADVYTVDLYTNWSNNFIVELGDKVEASDGTIYKVKSIDDLVHYNVCYHLILERVM